MRDHPRVCGEKHYPRKKRLSRIGSPPRVRGKAWQKNLTSWHRRITPACAGKRKASFDPAFMARDHPRVCGEKVFSTSPIKCLKGSPPRVRGKGVRTLEVVGVTRITPACAGKSFFSTTQSRNTQDHPRVCGEKPLYLRFDNGIEGSPPRVRGKVDICPDRQCVDGITPACAGKRLKRSHSIGHFSYILCLFHSVLHRASASGGSRAGPCAPPCLPAQNAVPV